MLAVDLVSDRGTVAEHSFRYWPSRPAVGDPGAVTTSEAAALPRAFGGPGAGPGQFRAPSGIAVDAHGRVWVADTGNDRVQAFTRDGALVRVIAGRLKAPEGIAVDAAGNVYVADTGNRRVVQYSWWGGFVREFGNLVRPRAVALDAAGRLLVDDTGRVARFDTRTGAALPGTAEPISSPRDTAGDGSGGVWVAETGNHRIVHFGPFA
ncbi:NHL repeat-containing protein [Amycolatopsis australiensis]|uniref:NHL repeat-containing protein n=1 Tax=Amycolatopsis australiensis TaxID=546364 RepID=A0A1K1QMJ0_9PSEU|nr:NHL repeat-containing protein [Amycolatopsis australiensis]